MLQKQKNLVDLDQKGYVKPIFIKEYSYFIFYYGKSFIIISVFKAIILISVFLDTTKLVFHIYHNG